MNCCIFFIKSFIYFFLSSQVLHHSYMPRFLSSCGFNLLLSACLLFPLFLIGKTFSHGSEEWSHHQFAETVMSSQMSPLVQPFHIVRHHLFERSSIYLQLKCVIDLKRNTHGRNPWQAKMTAVSSMTGIILNSAAW